MPREKHKKSKNGCVTCKARRVKCSEDGPPCRNCVRRAVDCHYADPAEMPEPEVRIRPRLSAHINQKHLLEMELLHHYTSSTWRTFQHNQRQQLSRQEDERMFLQVTVPQQALRFDFTRDALFALTALHLVASSKLERKSYYFNTALQYQSWAQLGFAAAMTDPASDYGSALFITSLAFTVLALAVPRYFGVCNGDIVESNPIEDVLTTYKLFRGSKGILHKLKQGSAVDVLHRIFSAKNMSVFEGNDSDTRMAIHRLRLIVTKKYKSCSPSLLSQTTPDLIDELEWAFRRQQAGNMSTPLGWLISAPDDFVQDFTHGEPAAVIFFMHWCVLLHRASGEWWIPLSGPAMVHQLSMDMQKLGEEDVGEHERQAMEWCAQQVAPDARSGLP